MSEHNIDHLIKQIRHFAEDHGISGASRLSNAELLAAVEQCVCSAPQSPDITGAIALLTRKLETAENDSEEDSGTTAP